MEYNWRQKVDLSDSTFIYPHQKEELTCLGFMAGRIQELAEANSVFNDYLLVHAAKLRVVLAQSVQDFEAQFKLHVSMLAIPNIYSHHYSFGDSLFGVDVHLHRFDHSLYIYSEHKYGRYQAINLEIWD
jgi:hypothetical protein